MECMKSIYHILIERLRKQRFVAMRTEYKKDGSIEKKLADADDPLGKAACQENRVLLQDTPGGGFLLCEPFERPQRLIILGNGEVTRRIALSASERGFSVIVVDEAPNICIDGAQTLCDALPAALRCLHITDEDSIILASKRYAVISACIEQLWEEPKTAFLWLLDASSQTDWISRLEDEGTADAAWLSQMTVVIHLENEESAAQEMLAALGTPRFSESMNVIEFLGRLPADKIEQRRIMLTVAQASNEVLLGRKLLLFEDGTIVGRLCDARQNDLVLKAKEFLQKDGWALIKPDIQTGITGIFVESL